MPDSEVAWQLDGEIAHLKCGPLVGRVELDGLGTRFVVNTWNGELADAFGVLVTAGPGPRPAILEVGERYVRGADYVATYAATRENPIVPHFYWRAKYHAALQAVQIEMVMSVQTDLLDSQPEASINSLAMESRLFWTESLLERRFEELKGSEPTRQIERGSSGEHLFVFRSERLGLSYAQLVHPTDFVAAHVHSKDGKPWLVESTLFTDRLEKGVIRRGRICGWFLPAENDLEVAVELARQFVEEPLPLTT